MTSAIVTGWLGQILREEYEVRGAFSAREGLEELKRSQPDMVLLDLKMPGMGGIEFLRELKRMRTPVPTIVMSAYADVTDVVQAMKLGATDFITKPFHGEKLREDIRLFFSLSEKPQEKVFRERIVGKSPQIREVWKLIEKFAPSDISILLLGESGTGKELIAKALHYNSQRANERFVAVNCGAIPANLMESELFGHKVGSFTGALRDKKVSLKRPIGGTLFLDEIGNLSLQIQVKLLRVIQEREFVHLGGKRPIKVDVRLIVATNADLNKAIKLGQFREDLYHRIHAVTIHLPL